MKHLTIRQATTEDLPVLLRLYRELDLPEDDESDRSSLPTAEQSKIFQQIDADEHQRAFVAVLGDDVIATFVLMIVPNLAHGCSPWALVENVVVDPKRRGLGVGKAMMEFAMARAAEAGCYKLVLSSNIARTEAHRFYESLGWQQSHYGFSVRYP